MHAAPLRVILDANVLYPFTLRDTLLRSAAAGLFQPYWSAQILDEATRNLVRNGILTEVQTARLRAAMRRAFPEALVLDFEQLIEAMPNDAKDRHVAAAAVQAEAQLIVTHNLRDFQTLPDGIVAMSPDDFLCGMFERDPSTLLTLLRQQAEDLRNPPRTFEEVADTLRKAAPEFVANLLTHAQRAPPVR